MGHHRVSAATQVDRGSASWFGIAELLKDREFQMELNIAPLHPAGCALALGIAAGAGGRAINPAKLIRQIAPVSLNAAIWSGLDHLNGIL